MELDIKYHVAENLFRSFWVDLLQRELANKDLDSHQIIEVDGSPVLYLDEFDIEIELISNTQNRSMKLRLGDYTYETLVEQYLKASSLESISSEQESPFITEATFTIRDLKKGTRFFAIVKKYRGI
ncbi:hypothetical protein [Francisella adeliensis]|uniref:Uncharacterized protein n=1 Tax=Francisella adeliensis TaxID=2007306 RepID=A0A2Z4Y008_9GAMM|nr:hypothetical protein [Francisella adeliensis]AXA34082.1 hypothetical protein CDH04_06510 [Francisella adeliensis]MBK2085247.1 hypothetical protein [Francisella adeliensis]MBK2095985.1 hypothetical protein [Francisella adeliensis]QIW12322.1 hypothetical protein FZC43_06510 [Francisella adeliensis]QIW14196.1 hypothetical protein FZC44_06510 [Francisella adeliensis]